MKTEIVYTDHFSREFKDLAKKYKSIKEDLKILVTSLEQNPVQGVPLSKDCYKIRLAISSKGKGKSGGARIITYLFREKNKLYFLSIFDKSEKENISDKDREAILKLIVS
ncbi:type II toxin-antitoxin system RelE/ParE family toxin [Leptospira weilii]|uniref:type II toxin-antitoxin system RelE/ParE family toxin n=1 Tax=Leptospira weilii TaxID=28184 RepID=UPI001EF29DFD|nr:type II toxin-antitoxin system RelE/ParE family toxin [Leptospira weilii]ULH27705.1 type II toxin-antitoxin system RelE/ParE family toxin [Leptospira weilii]ULH27712.1 type II toxin-antitoxin system RelE/ParE family toxin [Leptospira weilii]UPY76977.1 type II toxin-antitoxin system RelE/ParE family toxin [Leptospira weilii]UPY76993.1 type II toxin-antitoxin system RelE/ParE family toxin [Leptospira weilii]UPY80426.1 type II toxin-antitoxin system RelE/ParE family toxin [Leptospira weilii]